MHCACMSRKMNIRSDLPIILCTGFSARMSETTALDLGIRAYVTKPVLIRQIAETIRMVLDAPAS